MSKTSGSVPRALLLPPLMPRMCTAAVSRTGRSASRALHVRTLVVLLHLVASELCVLSAACVSFVATGTFTATSSREASPPAWAPQICLTCACVLPHTGSLTNMQNGVLPPLMPRICTAAVSRAGRSVSHAPHVRALLVLLYLVASELCVLSAACLLFVATGASTATSCREASPPAWAP